MKGAELEKSRTSLGQDWSLPVDISRDGKTLLFDEQGRAERAKLYGGHARYDRFAASRTGRRNGRRLFSRWQVGGCNRFLHSTRAAAHRSRNHETNRPRRHPAIWASDPMAARWQTDPFHGKPGWTRSPCFIQSIDGGKPRAVTPEGIDDCQISPDGKLVAASSMKLANRAALSSGRRSAAHSFPDCCPEKRLNGHLTRIPLRLSAQQIEGISEFSGEHSYRSKEVLQRNHGARSDRESAK